MVLETNQETLIVDKHPFPVAGVLALLSLPLHAVLPIDVSYVIAAGIMSMIAGIYLGFAAIDGRSHAILLEGTFAVIFTAASMLALHFNPIWIAFVYISHGFWDAAHHSHGISLEMPPWYVRFCAAYDVFAGVGLWLIWTYL